MAEAKKNLVQVRRTNLKPVSITYAGFLLTFRTNQSSISLINHYADHPVTLRSFEKGFQLFRRQHTGNLQTKDVLNYWRLLWPHVVLLASVSVLCLPSAAFAQAPACRASQYNATRQSITAPTLPAQDTAIPSLIPLDNGTGSGAVGSVPQQGSIPQFVPTPQTPAASGNMQNEGN